MSEHIPQKELATRLGLTTRQVHNLAEQGVVPKRVRNGKADYPWPESLHKYIAWKIEAARDESFDEAKERARKLRADADLRELELAERRGLLIPADKVQERYEEFLGGFSAVAAGRLQRHERDIVRVSTPGEARALTQTLHRALMEGAQEYASEVEAEADAIEQAEEAREAA